MILGLSQPMLIWRVSPSDLAIILAKITLLAKWAIPADRQAHIYIMKCGSMDKSIDPVKFMTVGRQISVAGELRQSSLVE